ncbi:MAG TPA: hypothetical protein VMU38_02680 [Candidatus Binatia bacterium]|nr:hypothetical protein [Candidatus Binatia bacterium]
MNTFARRALTLAALFVIAGCSAGSTQSGTPATLAGSGAVRGAGFVHRGVPFLPFSRANAVARNAIHAAYSTKKSLVFEADQDQAAVNVYQTKALPKNPAPIASIDVSAGCPYGLVADKSGTIYVADNCGGNDVEEFPKGSTTLKTTITDGISNPLGLAMDESGTLYVSNYPGAITEYAAGTTSPSKTVTGGGLDDPFGLAVDKSGNLYIADFGAEAVFELPAGGSSVTNLNLQGMEEPIGLAFDAKTGYLWETDGGGDKINVYDLASSTSPIETISGNEFPYAISAENAGKPKGEVVVSDIETHDVYAFKPGQYTPYATLTNGVSLPTGLLVTKP